MAIILNAELYNPLKRPTNKEKVGKYYYTFYFDEYLPDHICIECLYIIDSNVFKNTQLYYKLLVPRLGLDFLVNLTLKQTKKNINI